MKRFLKGDRKDKDCETPVDMASKPRQIVRFAYEIYAYRYFHVEGHDRRHLIDSHADAELLVIGLRQTREETARFHVRSALA